jgi:hypothetical protein
VQICGQSFGGSKHSVYKQSPEAGSGALFFPEKEAAFFIDINVAGKKLLKSYFALFLSLSDLSESFLLLFFSEVSFLWLIFAEPFLVV